jgi:myosin heavy chain 6/7
LEDALNAANSKIASLDKTKSKLTADLGNYQTSQTYPCILSDDAQVDVERANTLVSQIERKQKGFDAVINEWKKKTDDLSAELDAAQRDARK